MLPKHNLDVEMSQGSWEKEQTKINIKGYTWFTKLHSNHNSPRRARVGYLVHECLINEVESINNVKYEESVWMKVHSERGRKALYIGRVYAYW